MTFDAIKDHHGQAYSGLAVGRGHRWVYRDGAWRETKLAPDEWAFTFESRKERVQAAPPDSGAAVGSQYHWLIVAHQFVRKVDANAYETFMDGHKFKVGHKRPHWLTWSYGYPGQESAEDRAHRLLMREALAADAARPPKTLCIAAPIAEVAGHG